MPHTMHARVRGGGLQPGFQLGFQQPRARVGVGGGHYGQPRARVAIGGGHYESRRHAPIGSSFCDAIVSAVTCLAFANLFGNCCIHADNPFAPLIGLVALGVTIYGIMHAPVITLTALAVLGIVAAVANK